MSTDPHGPFNDAIRRAAGHEPAVDDQAVELAPTDFDGGARSSVASVNPNRDLVDMLDRARRGTRQVVDRRAWH